MGTRGPHSPRRFAACAGRRAGTKLKWGRAGKPQVGVGTQRGRWGALALSCHNLNTSLCQPTASPCPTGGRSPGAQARGQPHRRTTLPQAAPPRSVASMIKTTAYPIGRKKKLTSTFVAPEQTFRLRHQTAQPFGRACADHGSKCANTGARRRPVQKRLWNLASLPPPRPHGRHCTVGVTAPRASSRGPTHSRARLSQVCRRGPRSGVPSPSPRGPLPREPLPRTSPPVPNGGPLMKGTVSASQRHAAKAEAAA